MKWVSVGTRAETANRLTWSTFPVTLVQSSPRPSSEVARPGCEAFSLLFRLFRLHMHMACITEYMPVFETVHRCPGAPNRPREWTSATSSGVCIDLVFEL